MTVNKTYMPKSHARTDAEAAAILGVNARTFADWKTKTDFPGRKVKAGWIMADLFKYQADRNARDLKKVAGENSDLKRRKLLADTLTAEHNWLLLKKSMIPVEQAQAEAAEYAAVVNAVFSDFLMHVEAMTRDQSLVAKARELEDAMRARLKARCVDWAAKVSAAAKSAEAA